MLEADGWLMFRFPRWPNAAHSLGKEVRLLDYLGSHLSIRVPNPLRLGTLSQPRGWPFMAYQKLPGTPLTNLTSLSLSERARLTRYLIRLFSQLSALPTAPLRRIGVSSGDRVSWAVRFQRLRRRLEGTAAGPIPAELHRRVAREFDGFSTDLKKSRYRPVLIHHDLWPSHILWDRSARRPVGVIDWEDARFGDPAFDLTEIRGIGSQFTEDLIAARRDPPDPTFEQRLLFYRRIGPLQSVLFGLETGRRTLVRAQLRRLNITMRAESLAES